MNNIETLPELIEFVEAFVHQQGTINQRVTRLEQQTVTQEAECQNVLRESKRAVDWAKHAFRVDHYGYIWVWDLELNGYKKTNMRICTPEIADEAITTDKLAPGSVKTEKIAPEAVTTDRIGAGEVKSGNIAPDAVTTDRIGAGEVKSRNIGEGAVLSKHIPDGNVTTDKIGAGEVKSINIAPEAVTTDRIGEGEVKTNNIAPHAVTRSKLDEGVIPELLGVMDEFMASVQAEVAKIHPETIKNVTNAADEEDLTAVSGLIKLANRSGMFGFAMKILRKEKSFAEQVDQTRCIYVVKYDFDLGGATVTMPAESIILFDGGQLTNGTLVGTTTTAGDPPGTAAFGLILCSALYYDYTPGVTLNGECQDETAKSLQDQINAIVMDKATVNLTATPSPVFVGNQATISLQATTNTSASSIKIKKGSTVLAAGSGLSLTGSDTITPGSAGNTAYTAEFVIAGLSKPATRNVTAVHRIYFGAAAADQWQGVNNYDPTPRTSPNGVTYNVPIASDGQHVFIIIPKSMVDGKTVTAKKGGFDFPLKAPVDVTKTDGGVDEVAYRVYQDASDVGYTQGTESITITVS